MKLHGKGLMCSISICDETGREVGTFNFIYDRTLQKRFRKLSQHFPAISKSLVGSHIALDGTARDSRSASVLQSAEQALYAALNDAAGCSTADAAFREMRPFAKVGTNLYAVELISAVTRTITEACR